MKSDARAGLLLGGVILLFTIVGGYVVTLPWWWKAAAEPEDAEWSVPAKCLRVNKANSFVMAKSYSTRLPSIWDPMLRTRPCAAPAIIFPVRVATRAAAPSGTVLALWVLRAVFRSSMPGRVTQLH